jgi:hypothetical protein
VRLWLHSALIEILAGRNGHYVNRVQMLSQLGTVAFERTFRRSTRLLE